MSEIELGKFQNVSTLFRGGKFAFHTNYKTGDKS